MATVFPENIDNLSNPNATDQLSGHAAQHANANDAIEALEAAVGTTNSEDSSSLTYKVNTLSSAIEGLTNNTDTISELLGLEGNNDLEVYGIENATTIDSFAKNTWKSIFYKIQITRGSDVYASSISVIQDGTDIIISESDILSNTDQNLFTYTFEENSGIINLRVTPISGSIAVRFYRTAIKA